MNSVYVKRYPSKGEFPNKEVFSVLTNLGLIFTFDIDANVKWWLEEIEVPTEEEIYIEAGKNSKRTYLAFEKGANFIISKLKGENNG